MPTKWLQERRNGFKNEDGIPPRRAFCGPSWTPSASLNPNPHTLSQLDTQSDMQTLINYKVGVNQNCFTFISMLLTKIVMCGKFLAPSSCITGVSSWNPASRLTPYPASRLTFSQADWLSPIPEAGWLPHGGGQCGASMQTLVIHKPGSNQNYYTFT